MDQQIAWMVELEILEGREAAFRELTRRMVAATKNEPGALVYERFVSEDGRRVVVYERYRDPDAAVEHLQTFGERFRAEFSTLVSRKRAFVFGAPPPHLKALMEQLEPEYLGRYDGFSRPFSGFPIE